LRTWRDSGRGSYAADLLRDTSGEIINDATGITVKINRRAYSPVPRDATGRTLFQGGLWRLTRRFCGALD